MNTKTDLNVTTSNTYIYFLYITTIVRTPNIKEKSSVNSLVIKYIKGLWTVSHCRERKPTSEGAHGKLGLAVFASKTRLLRLWSS